MENSIIQLINIYFYTKKKLEKKKSDKLKNNLPLSFNLFFAAIFSGFFLSSSSSAGLGFFLTYSAFCFDICSLVGGMLQIHSGWSYLKFMAKSNVKSYEFCLPFDLSLAQPTTALKNM